MSNFAMRGKPSGSTRASSIRCIVALGAIATTLPPSFLAGYIFARYRSKITEIAFYCILIGYFVPAQMVLIPLYKFEVATKLNDTLCGLFLVMAAFGIPFWTLIYRSFFAGLPERALRGRAHRRGEPLQDLFPHHASPRQPGDGPRAPPRLHRGLERLPAVPDPALEPADIFTMQLRVASFLGAYGTDRMPRYASAAIIAALPTIILYIAGHKWIIKGTIAGAVKE